MIGDIFQPTHLLFLLVIVLLVLGPKRLPEMARSLGRGFHDFKDAINGEDHSAMAELHQQPVPPPTPPTAEPVVTAPASVEQPAAPVAPVPEPVVATPASVEQPAAPVEPAPAPEPVFAPEPEPVASQASTDPAEGTG